MKAIKLVPSLLVMFVLAACAGKASQSSLSKEEAAPQPAQTARELGATRSALSEAQPNQEGEGYLSSSPTSEVLSTFAGSATASSFVPDTSQNRLASATISPTLPPSTTPTLSPDAWQEMPVIPVVSERVREIYRRGQEMGRDPHAFSKVGDCQNVDAMFLSVFDGPDRYFRLGPYEDLRSTIDWYRGSFERESQAVRGGFNAATMVSPLRADPKYCQQGETPLACEYRLHNPSIALISLETWWSKKPAETYEKYMRQVIEYSIEQGVVPILATKADNLEGDNGINAAIGKLAYEYQLPLWNFWQAVQPLPNHGLRSDGFHLTWAGNYFDDPKRMQSAWPIRNLTALQALDAVRKGLAEPEPPAVPTLTPTPTTTTAPTATPSPTATATPISPEFAAENWQELPVIPAEISGITREVFQKGIQLGNNPVAFSKVGDCGSTPAWFLGDFDGDPRYYSLGPYSNLEKVIQTFQGSFERTSLAAKAGFNVSSVFAPRWSNREQCQADETPLACEYRVHHPSMAFIMLGSNDVYHLGTFEEGLRRIIDFSLEQGVIPILSTKADNAEGDGSINATIAKLAYEYQVPLWNYWRAVQPLPSHGLQEDGVHITWASNHFDDRRAMQAGWPVRNLTALQMLEVVWRGVSEPH